MKKRLLCYDEENPVGVDENGVLNPSALGGGIVKLSDYVKIDMYNHPVSGEAEKTGHIQIDSIPVGSTILFNDITEVDKYGDPIGFVYQRGDGTTLWNTRGDNTGAAFMWGTVVCLFVSKSNNGFMTVVSWSGKDEINLSNNTVNGQLLKYE